MNVLRRALLAFYSAVLVAAAGGFTVLAWNGDRKLDVAVGRFNLQAFITTNNADKWAFTMLMAAVALAGVVTFLLAFQRAGAASNAPRMLRLRQADGGTVEVTDGAIQQLLREQLEQLPAVRKAETRVRMRAETVESDITVTIDPAASIASVTAAVADETARTFKELVSVTRVRRPHIRIAYENAAAAPPAGTSAAAAPPAE